MLAAPDGRGRSGEDEMNWVAIIAATVVNMVLGSLWFSPMLF